MNYPISKQIEDSYELHGQTIEDNFSWMEEQSEDLIKWIESQNSLSEDFLSKSDLKEKFLTRMKEITNFERKSLYKQVGDYKYYSKNSGLENLPKIYRKNNQTQKEEVFLDPNKLSEDATSPIVSYSFSKDNNYCAYSVAKAGADWVEVKIIEVESKKELNDHIIGVKFDSDVFSSGVSFYKNGFFYPKYINDTKQVDYLQKDLPGELWYHRIGTSQEEDILVYREEDVQNLIVGSYVDKEEKYLVIPTSTGCIGNELLVTTLDSSLQNLSFKKLFNSYDNKNQHLGIKDSRLFILSNKDVQNRNIISYNLNDNTFDIVVKELETPIESAKLAGSYIVVETLEDVQCKLFFYTLDGKKVKTLSMPNKGTFLGMSNEYQDEVYFGVSSFLSPMQIYKLNLKSLDYVLYSSAKVNFDFENYEVLQEFATSKDSTKVPAFIIKRKGLELNSKNPTILYGYGGFNISLLPVFSPKILSWVEQGGVYVFANLRGGGEYGEKWHRAGQKHNKQNVFDDAHAWAEYLIENKYCSQNTLAIQGGSNGGLLAATCALQRPDLYSVSLPAAGVLDMLKYQNFTCGYQWSDEYGVATKKEDFKTLLSYSPYHIIDTTKEYPAFLVTCADLDDRVVSAHSYKFVAKLQQAKGDNPYLIRVETNSSHGASNLSKYLEESADSFVFTLMNFK
ncbi:MAG: prolyl oligopeptidase family serine peptidase [Nanoarchaeota archaeon]|nr:prolyl oligopeptidase family serine peptidase [Nanoarchaeota archaeon]